MTQQFNIVGAGMAGLFAGAILRDQCRSILEAQPDLPHNHSALLRFRSSVVGDALNIPFRPVTVMKTVDTTGDPIRDAILYSRKTNGKAHIRSIIDAKGEREKRFIAPPDLIKRMAEKVTGAVYYDHHWAPNTVVDNPTATISTIPMPYLMEILNYPQRSEFNFGGVAGATVTIDLQNVDLCATMYFPHNQIKAYRASITETTLIIEYINDPSVPGSLFHSFVDDGYIRLDAERVLRKFGLNWSFVVGEPVISGTKYAKILPIDERLRKSFIMWASDKHNIYSLGRFATWRPGLLLDDLYRDIQVIQSLANGASSYDHRK